jgi:tetratricopeptide (TPR) repeat protein
MRDALVHFRQAASLDAQLWYGYVGIADSYLGLLLLANRMDPEWAQWARHAAERAVQLGPGIAVARCALGSVRLIIDWDLDGAEASFEEALRCNPFSYVAYQRRGLLRTLQRRFAEARVDFRRATELKPEFYDGKVFWAWSEFCAGNFDGTVELLKNLPPSGGKRKLALRILASTYGMKRQFESARKTLALARLFSDHDLAVRAWLDAREGNIAAAKSGLDRLCADYGRDSYSYCDTAVINAEIGLNDGAFASLERGLQLRHWKVLILSVDPRLESLHKDARWHALRSRIGAREA